MKHSNFPGRRPASILLACASLLLAACGGGGGSDNGGGGGGNQKPTASIVFPPMEAIFTGDVLTVRGTASDDGDVDSVTVNGVAATSSDGFATWTAKVSLANGANELVVAVEDDDGETTASAASVNVTRVAPLLAGPTGIEVDATNSQAFVLDSSLKAIFRIDLETGERSLVSSAIRGTGPDFRSPLNLEIDSEAAVAYVADSMLPGIIAVNLVNGNRSVVSSSSIGEGPEFGVIRDLALDEAGERVFTMFSDSESVWYLLEVDIATGDRALVVQQNPIGDATAVFQPFAIEWDAFSGLVILGSFQGQLATVDPVGGTIDVVTTADDESAHGVIYDIAPVEGTDIVLVLGGGGTSVWQASLSGGTQLVSSDARGTGPALKAGNPIALDDGRILVGELYGESIVAIDAASGNRSVLAGIDDVRLGSGPAILGANEAWISKSLNAAFVQDRGSNAIVRINLANGSRASVASLEGLDFDKLVLDEAGGRLLALDGHVLKVSQIALNTGVASQLFLEDAPVAPFTYATAAMLDAPRNRIVYHMYNSDELRALSLDDFSTTVLTGGGIGSGDPLRRMLALALVVESDVILSAATDPFALQGVNLSDGARADFLTPGNNVNPELIVVTAMAVAANQTYLLDQGAGRIVRLHLATMDRTIVGGNGSGSDAGFGIASGLLVDDDAMLAWTVDTGVNGLVVFDLTSGDHVIVSR